MTMLSYAQHRNRPVIARIYRDENGASAVEYGLLVAGIAALIVLVVFAFGGVIKSVFGSTCSKVATNAKSGSVASCTT